MLHKHHIIPRHMGGTDDISNIETLSVPEHANRHLELWYLCGKKEDYVAWKVLSGQLNNQEIWIEKSRLGGLWHKGKKSEAKSIAHLGKPKPWLIGRKLTKEHIQKITLATTGKKRPEFAKLISNVQKRTYLIMCPNGIDIISFGMINPQNYNLDIKKGKLYSLARNKLPEYKGFKVIILEKSKRKGS